VLKSAFIRGKIMNKNIIITILVLLVLTGVGYYFFTKFRVSTLFPELPQPTTQPVSEVLTTQLLQHPRQLLLQK
jgi:hypothetical protein